MKIVSLSIANFKRISAVEIRPCGSAVNIAGNNGQGKTSVLDAIMVALVGPKAMPGMPVRQGEESAEITIDCGDATITRRIKPDGSQALKVVTKDGTKGSQTWLDQRIGSISFDPLSFTRQPVKAQAETLRQLVGLDLSDIDAEARRVYDERTALNRDVRNAEGELAGLAPLAPNVPVDEVSAAQILTEIRAAQNVAAERERLERDAAFQDKSARQHSAAATAANERLATISSETATRERELTAQVEREIADLQARINAARNRLTTGIESLRNAAAREKASQTLAKQEAASKAEAAAGLARAAQEKAAAVIVPDIKALESQLASVETTNKFVRANAARVKVQKHADALRTKSAAMTARLYELANERQARIAGAKYPIAGLGFDDDGAVTYNGIPLAQASQAEQIKVSMAIGLALNPEMRVVLVRDASLLDAANRQAVAEMAAAADAQVWLETIDSGDTGAVVIEDGAVRS